MFSKICLSICVVVILAFSAFCPRWDRSGGESSLGWDVSGYYWYLPSIFIYQDLKNQAFKDSVLEKYQFTGSDFQQGYKLDNGNYVLKYSSGMAIMFSPFFFIAHLIAPLTAYPADGFSKPYLMAISFGSLLISFAGLWFFRKLLLRYYNDVTVGITLLLLVVSSNYLNYSAIDGSLSHNWLFTVYVIILLLTDNFYNQPRKIYAAAIGLLCGLATLTRPTEIICLLIPLLWKIKSVSLFAFKERIHFLKKNIVFIALAIICFAAVVSIQLFYWKYVSGHWLVYSYGEQGFSWLSPHLFNYTLSYKSGWLVYTPIAFFTLIGILPFIKYGQNKLAVLIFFAANLYIVCAWDIWWYAGTGGRAMIQSYPVIFFPMASFVDYILRKKWLSWVSLPFILIFTYANIWITVQAHGGGGLYDATFMNREYYWKVISRWTAANDNIIKLKDTNEIFEKQPKSPHLVYNYIPADCLQDSIQYGKIHTIVLSNNAGKAAWIRAEATFSISEKEWNVWCMSNFTIRFLAKDQTIKEKSIRLQRFLSDGDHKKIYIDAKMPSEKVDSVQVFVWNANGTKKICYQDLSVIFYRSK